MQPDPSSEIDFTVVTISFNQLPFLERAIRSVLTQAGVTLEYVVVDPGSTDGSREIISSFPGQIRSLLEPDEGPADGLNKGFARARGTYLAFVNADDFLLPGALERAKVAFETRPGLDVLLGSGWIVDANGTRQKLVVGMPFTVKGYAYGTAEFLQQATFFKREAFLSVGGFNHDNHVSWDGELLLRMRLAGASFRATRQLFGAFTIYPESISGGVDYRRRLSTEHARLFALAQGRLPRDMDRLFSRLARVYKWGRHPLAVVAKLTARRRLTISSLRW